LGDCTSQNAGARPLDHRHGVGVTSKGDWLGTGRGYHVIVVVGLQGSLMARFQRPDRPSPSRPSLMGVHGRERRERAGSGLGRATGTWGHGAMQVRVEATDWGSIRGEGEVRER
jgi:hypothetical protein